MPVDNEGNITTTPSVVVKTITDVMHEDKVDVIPLMLGGIARIAQDKADGKGVVLTASTSTPKA
jgi:hypothetical protein